MSIPHEHYGPAHGPLGFPQTDRQARALEALLKELPQEAAFGYRKMVIEKATSELLEGERADVSWISTEDPDRAGEVVVAQGMNDAQFALNPIVTLNHDYSAPPVGKSLWRRRVRDGERVGIKAKTLYPKRPVHWPEEVWPPDAAFGLVQAELLRGKSIGFLPVKVHVPSDLERKKPGWEKTKLVIDEWILLEYACVFLPAQQHAVVEAVSKSGLPLPGTMRKALRLDSPPFSYTAIDEVERSVKRVLAAMDFGALLRRTVNDRLDRLRGRV